MYYKLIPEKHRAIPEKKLKRFLMTLPKKVLKYLLNLLIPAFRRGKV